MYILFLPRVGPYVTKFYPERKRGVKSWHKGLPVVKTICHTAIENLSDPIGYLLDFTNPYYTALVGNMKARAKKDNSFWNHA